MIVIFHIDSGVIVQTRASGDVPRSLPSMYGCVSSEQADGRQENITELSDVELVAIPRDSEATPEILFLEARENTTKKLWDFF